MEFKTEQEATVQEKANGYIYEQPTSTNTTNVTLNYIVIALTCLGLGLFIGWATFGNQESDLDAETVRAIVEDTIAGLNLATEEQTDRFELVDNDPYMGSEDAPIVIVEFGDFRCSFCGRHFEQTFIPLLETYGEHIRYVYRDFPGLGQESVNAAIAAECANQQGIFWDYHTALFSRQGDIGAQLYLELAEEFELDMDAFSTCLDSEVVATEVNVDFIDGQINQVQGTPSFFINGEFIRGAQRYELFERIILRELAKAGIETTPEVTEAVSG